MTRFKYVKYGVKRKHNIIDGILPVLEQIAKIEGVKKVVPASISYSPKRHIGQPQIKFQRNMVSGFKLLAHGKGAIQEIYITINGEKKEEIEAKLKEICAK